MRSAETDSVVVAAVRHHLKQSDIPMARLVAANWKESTQSADGWALWALVCLHPGVRELDEGIKSAARAMELSSTSSLGCLALAKAHVAKGDVAAAKVVAARAVALNPDEAEAAVLLSALHIDSDEHIQALNLLLPLADRTNATEDVLTAAAELLLNHHPERVDQAMGWLKRSVALAPHRAENRALKAMAHLTAGDVSNGREELHLALALHPDHPEVLYQLARLGTSATSKRDAEEAIDFARRAVALSPAHWRAKMLLSDLLGGIGLNSDAFKVLADALEAESKRPELWLRLARQAALLGQAAIANEALENAAKTLGEDPQLTSVSREVQLLLGNWKEACALAHLSSFHARAPAWDASQAPDSSPVFVVAQSSRDLFMNARFLPILKRRYPNVVLCLEPTLHGMASIIQGIEVKKITEGIDSSSAYVLALAALPQLVKDALDVMPAIAHIGPSTGSATSIAEVRERHDGPCWFIGPSLEELLPDLVNEARSQSALLITLSDTAADIRRFQPSVREDHIVEADDWDSVCSWMQASDAVVLSDDTLAHVAGAQGIAANVLVDTVFDPQWGWKLDRSLWFPSVQLHRMDREDRRSVWRQVAPALGVAEAGRILS